MLRPLLAAVVLAGATGFGVPASACTIDQCWFSKPVCDQLNGCCVQHTHVGELCPHR